MAIINEEENVPPIDEIAGEIHTHAVRIQALQERAKLAVTPDDKLAVALEIASEVTETIMPLFADFSKATVSELADLNDEVFGIKIGPAEAQSAAETLEACKSLAVNNPALLAQIEAAQDILGGNEGEDDEDDPDEDDEDEEVGAH